MNPEDTGSHNENDKSRRKGFFGALLISHLTIAFLGLVMLVTTFTGALFLRDRIREAADVRGPVFFNAMNILNGIHESSAALNGWISRKDTVFAEARAKAWALNIEPAARALQTAITVEKIEAAPVVEKLLKDLRALKEEQWWVEDIAHNQGAQPTLNLYYEMISPVAMEARDAITAIINLEGESENQDFKTKKSVVDMANLRFALSESMRNLERFLEAGRVLDEKNCHRYNEDLKESLDTLRQDEESFDAVQMELYQTMAKDLEVFLRLSEKAIAIRKSDRWNVAAHMMKTEVEPLSEKCVKNVETLLKTHSRDYEREIRTALGASELAISVQGLLMACMIVASVIVAYTGARKMAEPVWALLEAMRRFGAGEESADDIKVTGARELEALADSFNDMRMRIVKEERALEESLARMISVLNTAPDGIISVSESGAIISANPAAARMFGCAPEELLGLKIHAIIKLNNELSTASRWESLVSGGWLSSAHIVADGLRQDGPAFPVEISIGMFTLGTEKLFTWITRDVSERKRQEEKLVKNERILAEAQRIAHIGAWERNLTTGEVIWSDETCRIFGVKPEDAPNPTIDDIRNMIHPDDLAGVVAHQAKALENGEPMEVNYRIIRPDGNIRVVTARAEFVPGPNGKPARLLGTVHDITEQIAARKAIEASEKKFRSLMENANDAIFIADYTGKIIEVNKKAEALLGKTRDKILTFHFSDMHPAWDAEKYIIAFAKMWDEGVIHLPDAEVITASGKVTPVDINASIIEIDGERIAQGIFRDMTENRRAEEDLKTSEAKFRTSFEYAVIGKAILSPRGSFLQVNRALQEMSGYSSHDLHGRSIDEIMNPEDSSKIFKLFASLLYGETQSIQTECRLINKNGNVVWGYLNASLALDTRQSPMFIISQIQDITSRKKAEQQLVLFRDMLDRSNDSIFVTDLNSGRFLDVNLVAATAHGYTKEQLLRLTAMDVVVSAPDFTWENHIMELRKRKAMIMEGQHQRRDGSVFPVEVNLAYSVMEGKEYLVAIARDITERKKRQELEIITKSLEITNRELNEFAYVASHDLQEPLRTIIAFSDRLMTKFSSQLDEKGVDYLRRTKAAAIRMSGLIEGLLEYSRITSKSNPMEPLNLDEVVKEALEDIKGLIDKVDANIEMAPLPEVMGDRFQIRRLFQNIISNSLKYRRPDVAPVVKIWAEPVTTGIGIDTYNIFVKDNGIGFEQKYAGKIFKVFERLHGNNEYEGTGIGLATVKKIVERHGGVISAVGTPGEGATFMFTLPHPDIWKDASAAQ